MTCTSTSYPALSYARKVAAHKRDASGGLLWIYKCGECDAWHLGTRDEAASKSSGPVYATFAKRRRLRR